MKIIDLFESDTQARSDIHVVLSELQDVDFAAAYKTIMAAARQNGLHGFGGNCWATAVAINRVVFGGNAVMLAAMNAPLFEKGRPIGHSAVIAREACWDADGRPKDESEIEAWGMLDFQDSDYRNMYRRAKIEWTEQNADDAGLWEFSEQEFIEATQVQQADIARCVNLLQKAGETWCSTTSAISEAEAGVHVASQIDS